MKFPRSAKAAACAFAAIGLVAGCSSSGSPASGSGSTQKVTLTFWSWVPNMQKVVNVWNEAHPDIQIKFTEAAGGDAELAKLLTAGKAKDMPDMAQIEYQSLPTMVSNDYLADISQYDANLKSDYPSGLWSQVTVGTNALYGVPQDAAPLAFFGKYLEVIPNARLVWTNEESDDAAVTTVTFEEKDGKTLLTLHELYPSKEALDEASGMEGVMSEQFEQLDELLLTLGA